VQIWPTGFDKQGGAYKLLIKPEKAYDAYEPNDDIRHSASISLGRTIEANIMDSGDTDFYQFKTSRGGNVLVSVANRSLTLLPGVSVYDADRENIGQTSASTAGADLKYSFASQPNSTYYVQIWPAGFDHPGGNYSLTITEQ